MATQTFAARMANQYLENHGWIKAARNVERGGENAAGFFSRVGFILWRVSVDLEPFLRTFSPVGGMQYRNCSQLSVKEKAEIDGFLMGL